MTDKEHFDAQMISNLRDKLSTLKAKCKQYEAVFNDIIIINKTYPEEPHSEYRDGLAAGYSLMAGIACSAITDSKEGE